MNAVSFSELIEDDCFEFLNIEKKISKKYDIIFLDPPYRDKKINILIDLIIDKKILNENGIILIHRYKKDNIEISSKLNVIDIRKYGISKIVIGD